MDLPFKNAHTARSALVSRLPTQPQARRRSRRPQVPLSAGPHFLSCGSWGPPGPALRVCHDVGRQLAQTCTCEVTAHPAPALSSDSTGTEDGAPWQAAGGGTHVPFLCPLLPRPPSLPCESTSGPRPSAPVTRLRCERAGDAVHTCDSPAPSGGRSSLPRPSPSSERGRVRMGRRARSGGTSGPVRVCAAVHSLPHGSRRSVRSSVRPCVPARV